MQWYWSKELRSPLIVEGSSGFGVGYLNFTYNTSMPSYDGASKSDMTCAQSPSKHEVIDL